MIPRWTKGALLAIRSPTAFQTKSFSGNSPVRPDGSRSGFDYEQAVQAIAHPVPEGYDPSAEDEED